MPRHARHARQQREKGSFSPWVAWRAWRVMQFCIPGCKEEPPLRANSKAVHLTYAAIYRGALDFDSILESAKERAPAARQACAHMRHMHARVAHARKRPRPLPHTAAHP